MFLSHAEGRFFRSYKSLSLDFTQLVNFFHGPNGQGQTSILEAIYTCLRGQSFRPFAGASFIQEGAKEAFLEMRFKEAPIRPRSSQSMQALAGKKGPLSAAASPAAEAPYPEREFAVQARFSLDEGRQRLSKRLFYSGKKASRPFLERKIPILVWIGEKLEAIKGGSSPKRQLADEALIFSGEREAVGRFHKTLKEKTHLLLEFKRGRYSLQEARRTLDALNSLLLPAAVALTAARLRVLSHIFQRSSGLFPGLSLSFEYFIEGRKVFPESPIEGLIQEGLRQKADVELEAGRPLSGPSRHEIAFLCNGRNARFFCSQGEQRIFALSLLLAQAEGGPLILLDDMLSELDEAAQERLLELIQKTGSQAFITSAAPPRRAAVMPSCSFFEARHISSAALDKGLLRSENRL